MPPRISRQSNASASAGTKATKHRKVAKSQKRALNAFTAAQHTVNDDSKIRRHRLGELEPDTSRAAKRRRTDGDNEDGDEDDEDAAEGGRDMKRSRSMGDYDEDRGSDSSGNEWRMGGPIGEDSDSSIDSDEAFGSSDEEKFAGYTFRGSSTFNKPGKGKKNVKRRAAPRGDGEMSLDEDEGEDEEEEDDFGEEGVDLATMLDDPGSDEDSGSGSEGDTESDDEESGQSASEDDDARAAKISKLQDLVASLEQDTGKARGGPVGDGDAAADAHESRMPSDFGVTSSTKLSISDLLPSVTDPALRSSLKLLSKDGDTGKKPTAGIPGRLSAPLPKRQQDRIDRVAASGKAREELDKWQDTVIQNRRAEHLVFPLPNPDAVAPEGTSTLPTQGEPQTELESAIAAIMAESGLGTGKKREEEAAVAAAEELEMKSLPVEEVMARRAALRKARELLFREEIKAKRIKKIKSKAYRRVHRRERERVAERDRELMGEEELEDERERQDRRRAEERMGAKHKESKWAKAMKKSGRTVWDDDARDGVVDMARRNEELRRRIEGREAVSGEESSDEGEEDDDADSADERARLGKKLDRIDAEDSKPTKGIGAMAFMQRAEAARKARNDETIEQIKRDLAENSDAEREDKDNDDSIGRRVFGPKSVAPEAAKTKKTRPVLEEAEDSAAEDDEDEAQIIVEKDKPERPRGKGQAAGSAAKSNNVGSKAKANGTGKASGHGGGDADYDSDDWLTAKTKPKKSAKTGEASSTSVVPLTIDLPASKPQKKTAKQDTSSETVTKSNSSTTRTKLHDTNASDSDSEAEQDAPTLSRSDLHTRAFAGDDYALTFETEKTAQTNDEDTQYGSTHLPGWGSWTGSALPKAIRKSNARAAHNPLFKTKTSIGTRAADRRDAKLKDVIISEAQGRKGKKYLAGQVPHGFEAKEQYERSLRLPVGQEWATKEAHQRATKPRVIKIGRGVVGAIERPLV